MQRQRGELVPIGEVVVGLDGPVKAIREASPQAHYHFTQADQVNQLVSASEADPDLGFMARMMALCSLSRTNPGDRKEYKRVNGPFTLYMIAGGGNKLPYGNLPRLILAWVSTEAVRTQSRELVLGRSDSRSQEASQAADAAPTLRYGPAGDSAPRLRLGGNSENGKNRTLSDQQRSASDLNRRVCGVSPHQAFQLHSGLEFFLLGRGDLCGQLDLEIAQSIGLTGGNPKTTSLSTAPLAYDFFRFLRRPLTSLPAGINEDESDPHGTG